MKDVLEDLIDKGIPVIDNTKDAAHYRSERIRRDKENLAKHEFVQNAELGTCSIDSDTANVRRRVSFDFVYFQHGAGIGEWNEELEAALKKRLGEQLLQTVTGMR